MRGRNCVKGGFVYVFKNSNNEFKIGSSNNVEHRLSNIRCGCPSAVMVFKSKVLSNRKDTERSIHKSLSNFNVGGEWFNCDGKTLLKTVNSITSNIGLVMSEGQLFDFEEFESALESSKNQATGILCKVNATKNNHIIKRYKAYLEVTSLNQLSWFISLSSAEQFLQAATVLANTFISNEKNTSNDYFNKES